MINNIIPVSIALDCLQICRLRRFYLINWILLKIYFIIILLTFKYLVAFYQKTELWTISSQLKLNSSLWQIIAAIVCLVSDQNYWRQYGANDLKSRLDLKPNTNKAKNVIIFVGDGMGVQTHTASRIYKGQKMGKSGEDEILEWEKFPYTGQSKTYNTDFQVSMTTLVLDRVQLFTRWSKPKVTRKFQVGFCVLFWWIERLGVQ